MVDAKQTAPDTALALLAGVDSEAVTMSRLSDWLPDQWKRRNPASSA
jgi:hypothetical protein